MLTSVKVSILYAALEKGVGFYCLFGGKNYVLFGSVLNPDAVVRWGHFCSGGSTRGAVWVCVHAHARGYLLSSEPGPCL